MEREDGGWPSFATLAEAKAAAQESADFSGEPVEIHKDLTADRPPRELAALLLNGAGWCRESVWAFTVHPSRAALKALAEAEG
jgi:hypothetical protein